MGTDFLTGCVEQLGLRRLKGPLKNARHVAAGVDLRALAVSGKDGLLFQWRLDAILREDRGRNYEIDHKDEERGSIGSHRGPESIAFLRFL
jgi:hypothetical protein